MPSSIVNPPFRRIALLVLAGGLLAGCNAAERLANLGAPPPLSKIEDPTVDKNYRPVALPMPRPEPVSFQANSLWRPGSRQFFKDQRAAKVGDIITVTVSISDKAKFNNSTTRQRDNSENVDLPKLLGAEALTSATSNISRSRAPIDRLFPGIDVSNALDVGATSNSQGKGSLQREETINLKVAAIVTQVLPNGNLVISGRQEVRVNFEMRELQITGVVRPADITATNVINHTQIAEARISYGGRGILSDVQQPRYGQQIFDVIFPF
ncbi:MAG: flagellar basal body L-ring protein FlgH [Alphaproteobacteria bacterium]|nr:flagellar basal body L-ring protein FlgH [Alphaproteobacteria bacterium]